MLVVQNDTNFPAYATLGGHLPLTATIFSGEPVRWLAQIVVKATYAVSPDGVAVPDDDQLPIVAQDEETENGLAPGELALEKGGVDIVVIGSARAPAGRAVRELTVELRIGGWSRVLQVTGDRFWQRAGASWLPTEPVPFQQMPLDYKRAFGGVYRSPEGAEIGYARNPLGKGWNPISAAVMDFSGRPLPNIELPGERLTTPSDEPVPAGFAAYPIHWALRLEHGVRQTAAGNPVLLPRLWNSAHPACVMDSYPQDSVCSLSGMTAEGRFICTAPRPAFYLEHALCGASEQLAAQPDLLCLLPDQQRLFTLTRWLVPIDMTDREVSRQVRICRT